MISTIHEESTVNTGRKDRKTNVEIKKPYAFVQYNKFMKGVDRADQYRSYYSVLRKTLKWLKKVVLYLLNCALFNTFSVYRTLNTNKKVKYVGQSNENLKFVIKNRNFAPLSCRLVSVLQTACRMACRWQHSADARTPSQYQYKDGCPT